MLEIHPIPLLGGLLKPATCVVGEMSSILDDVLKVEMGVWDKCLPDDPEAANCENDCLYQGSVLMRGGNMALPVSDTMERLAKEDGELQSALNHLRHQRNEGDADDIEREVARVGQLSERFASLRMNASIHKALAGHNIDEL